MGGRRITLVVATDTRASFSETSYPNVFLSAPGVCILSDSQTTA
jgi:hypothetical protein